MQWYLYVMKWFTVLVVLQQNVSEYVSMGACVIAYQVRLSQGISQEFRTTEQRLNDKV